MLFQTGRIYKTEINFIQLISKTLIPPFSIPKLGSEYCIPCHGKFRARVEADMKVVDWQKQKCNAGESFLRRHLHVGYDGPISPSRLEASARYGVRDRDSPSSLLRAVTNNQHQRREDNTNSSCNLPGERHSTFLRHSQYRQKNANLCLSSTGS